MRKDKELIGLLLDEFDIHFNHSFGLCFFVMKPYSIKIINSEEENRIFEIFDNNKPITKITELKDGYWWKLGIENIEERRNFLKEIYEKL